MEKEKSKQDNSKRKRHHQIVIRCSDEELEQLNQAIEKSRLKRVDFLLSVLQNGNVMVVDDLQEVCVELKKQGVNLNQSLCFAYERSDTAFLMQAVKQCNLVYEQAKELLFATAIKVKQQRTVPVRKKRGK